MKNVILSFFLVGFTITATAQDWEKVEVENLVTVELPGKASPREASGMKVMETYTSDYAALIQYTSIASEIDGKASAEDLEILYDGIEEGILAATSSGEADEKSSFKLGETNGRLLTYSFKPSPDAEVKATSKLLILGEYLISLTFVELTDNADAAVKERFLGSLSLM